jgi:hypothetical protein
MTISQDNHVPREAPQNVVEKHDPSDRKMAGEPSIEFLARDALSPGLSAVYAAIREMKFDLADQLYAGLKATRRAQPFHPQKDPEHAVAVRQLANEMRAWRFVNMPKPPVEGHVNAGPERGEAATTADGRRGGERRIDVNSALAAAWSDDFADRRHAATNRRQLARDDGGPMAEAARLDRIKTARPPVEPEEAQ